MNILIISESFLKGGLETYIYTMYEELKKNNNVYFAFGNFESDIKIPKQIIYDYFHFSFKSTIENFIEDVEKIIKIIKEKKINLIIINPFFSFFPAIFAAQITKTKIVYIYHGRGSLNFPSNMVEIILFRYAFESTINKVFCVSEQGINAFKTINYEKTVFLPNPINDNFFRETKVINNKKWAIISRLDDDKFPDIIKFLQLLPNLDIDNVDIFGDGNQKNNLEDYIRKNHLESKITLKGYTANIYDSVIDQYTGLIGVGRAAIEGLTMNYPVLLIGYNKVVGVIQKKIYNDLKNYNFVPNYCDEMSKECIQNQIKEINDNKLIDFQFRNEMIKDFGIKKVIKTFFDSLENINIYQIQNLINFYVDLKKINPENKNNSFYYSDEVYDLLVKNISPYTNDFNLKTSFTIFNYFFEKKIQTKSIEDNILLIKDNQISLENKIIEDFNNTKLSLEKTNTTNLNKTIELYFKEIDSIKKTIIDQKKQILKLKNESQKNIKANEKLTKEINNIYNSYSWKITKPIRKIKKGISEIFKK